MKKTPKGLTGGFLRVLRNRSFLLWSVTVIFHGDGSGDTPYCLLFFVNIEIFYSVLIDRALCNALI